MSLVEAPRRARFLPRLEKEPPSADILEFESPAAALMELPVRPIARNILWTVVSLVIACGIVAWLIPVDVVITTQGRIVSRSPTQVVQPLETSIVRKINVQEGQEVHKGDILASLDSTFTGADASALQVQVTSLKAEVDRLTAEAAGVGYVPSDTSPVSLLQLGLYNQRQGQYRSQVSSFDQKLNSLQSLIDQSQSEVLAMQERVQIAETLESKRIELERLQVGSQMNRLIAQDQRIEMQRNLTTATGTVERAKRELQQVSADKDAFEQNWKAQVSQELAERRRSYSDVDEGLRKASLRRDLIDLRADQDATVLTVAKVSVGSVMQSGDQLITLVPKSSILEVETRIEGADAGYIKENDPVKVKFDTFPYIQYGMATGHIRIVSPDSFTGSGTQFGLPDQLQRGASFYKAKVAIDKIEMRDVPGGFALKPGMPVTADIKVGRRTLLTYLFSRIAPLGMEGMREP